MSLWFYLHFLNNYVGHQFVYLLAIPVSSLINVFNCSVFKIGLVVLLLLSCNSFFFFKFWDKFFYHKYDLQIIFSSLWLVISFFNHVI